MHRKTALLFSVLLAGAAHSQIVINEVGIAPPGGNGSQFVELFNRSGCTVDLSCYTLAFSSVSGTGNPTGWTIKIPSGKNIAGGGYFLLGGTAGTAGVSAGTGYPTGGVVNSYAGTADVNVGTVAITANAVYMKQFLSAGSFPNSKGQLSLLDASGSLVASVSYNNGNNAASYPLSTYTTCGASGNVQGLNNVPDPGASANNIPGTFSAATNQGIYLTSSGTYLTETSLTPGASNVDNGGTQTCSGPVLNTVSNVAVCFGATDQTVALPYSSANAPVTYSVTWDATASVYFALISNAFINANISVAIPGSTPPGNYNGYLTLNNACGSSCTKPFTVTINALPLVDAGNYAPVCTNGSSVQLNGTPAGGVFTGTNVTGNNFIPPNTAGNYTVHYTYTDAISGCSNNASSTINVSAPASTYTTACTSSRPFLFFGQPLTTTGLHTVLLDNANGCTDTARIYLVVKETETLDTTGCDSVLYNGTMYYNDANLTETVSSVVTACDSLVKNVRIRIMRPTVKDTTICLPPNGSVSLLGQTFAASGNYVLHATNAVGCDSVIQLQLTVAQTQTQIHTGCDSVLLNGQRFYTSTVFLDTLRNGQGCDSLIRTHNVVVNRSAHTHLNVCLATGQTYNFNGHVLNASGNYTATLTSMNCDSIVHLHLLVAQTQTVSYQGCTAYTYNGVVYTTSTTLHDTLRSVTGCDSVLRTIQILIVPVLHSSFNVCLQQGQTYAFGNQTLSASGHYTAQLTTQDGCDSIVHLYLTISTIQTQTISGCDSLLWRGRIYYTSTQVIDTVRSLLSTCDSLYRITNIVIHSSPVHHLSVCLAAGQSYLFDGQTLSSSGQYTGVFVRPGLCDSTVLLNLTIPVIQQQTISGCGAILYNGIAYTSSIVLRDTIRSIHLCDSVYRIVQITVLPMLQSFATACIRQGQSYNFNGQLLTANGHYSTVYHVGTCDSAVRLYLSVSQTHQQSLQGCDSVVFNGQVYFTSTIVRDTIRSLVSGCDSLITVASIVVHAVKHQYTTACLRPGQTYNFNGQMLTNTGLYQTAYVTAFCDSVVHLYLVAAHEENVVLRGCGAVLYNGHLYTTSSTVRDTVKSVVTTCDSLYREAQIIVQAIPPTFVTACVVPGGNYVFNGLTLSATGHYTTTYQTQSGCDSVVNLYLVAGKTNVRAISGCDTVVYKGTVYTASAQITDTVKSVVTQCDSVTNITTITVNKRPVITASRDTTICRWDTATLVAFSPGAVINWAGFGNANTIAVVPQTTTSYPVAALDANGCLTKSAVTVYVQNFWLTLSANKNPALSGTNVLLLSGGNLSYSVSAWQPASLFSNQTGKSQRVTVDTSINIRAAAQSTLGCRDTASLQIVAIPLDDVYVPSAFTPNGDGRNDDVRVMGTAIKEVSFTVFNRWGQVLFRTTDKSKGWDGKFAGMLQPAGTYVYVARVTKTNGLVVEKKGTITLLK